MPMTFVNPMLLAGAALVAVPIVLHLIMRRKPRHLEFPALRLVRQRHETNRRQVRLRHLVLLALRMGLVALFALALARPTLKFSGSLGSREAPVAAALVFDTAPRMEYREANRTRLQVAQELGGWLLAQLPGESRLAVLDTRAGPGVFQVDRAAAAARIERLATVASSRSLAETTAEAFRLLGKPGTGREGQSDLARKEVYVFTDLARATWPSAETAKLIEEAGEVSGVSVFLIDVGVSDPTDCGLGELRLSAQILPNQSPLEIRAEFARLGGPVERTIELHLADEDGQARKRDQQTARVEANGTAELAFQIGALREGTHQGHARIVGQDNLAANDVRWFTVMVQPPWRILVVDPKSPHSHADFLVQMLSPESLRKGGRAKFACDVIAPAALAEQDLSPYAAVCLVDPAPAAPEAWQRLFEYVSSGHGLAVFLGRNARPADAMNSPEAQRLLPGPLARQARAGENPLHLAPRELTHPVLSALALVGDSIPWSDGPVYRYWEFGPLATGVHVIIPYNDGRPALLERSVGRGRVLVLGTPLSDVAQGDPWNLLPVADNAWPLVITVNQMMLYLAGGADWRLNYSAGETATVPLGASPSSRPYVVTTPDGVKFPQPADPRLGAIAVTSTESVGNYRIQSGGQAERGFSVNLAPEQTELARLSPEELDELLGPLHFRLARDKSQIERDVSIDRVGRELFGLLILLIALVWAGEHVVANRFYRGEAGQSGPSTRL